MLGKFVILSLFISGALADCSNCKAAVGAIYQGLQTPAVQDKIAELVGSVLDCPEPETRVLDGFDICAVEPALVIGFLEQVELSQEEAESVCDHVPGACDRYTGQGNLDLVVFGAKIQRFKLLNYMFEFSRQNSTFEFVQLKDFKLEHGV